MYLPLLYCIKAVVCRLYEMLYPCSCNVVISCWKSGAYDIVICRGGTDMCFVPGSGWKHLDLGQYRISGLTEGKLPEVNPPSSRVPGRGLLALSILEARSRRNKGEIAKKGSFIGSLTSRRIYRRRGAAR